MSRFSTDVVHELKRAGWTVGRRRLTQAEAWAKRISDHVSPDDHRHSVFPKAVNAWTEFGGLHFDLSGPGEHVARNPFVIDPTRALHLARTLTDAGRALGADLCPLGQELSAPEKGSVEPVGTGYLAIDRTGRIFSLDHTGEWFLGEDMDSAVTTLVRGLAPARVRDDGTW